MTKKIADLSDFMNMMREVCPNIDPNKLDPDMVLLCFNMYTKGYNSAMEYVNDCLDRMAGRVNGGEN